MCRALRVSRSGYYKYLTRGMPAYQQRRKQVREHVMALFEKYQKRYGAPRLTRALKAENIPCCVNTVAKIMQQLQLRARNGRAFRYSQYSHSNVRVSENVLRRQFVATKPNTKWVTDITYIRFKGQWHYLATVMDLYSRAIVGWAFDGHMTEELIIRALNMAISRREIAPGLIIHSDRGVQYRSVRYQDLIMSIGAVSSMSRRSNCWDNAAMESFFSRMKVELIYGEKFNSLQEIKSCIFEYIEIFYNRVRQHSTLGYVSPYEYEATYA